MCFIKKEITDGRPNDLWPVYPIKITYTISSLSEPEIENCSACSKKEECVIHSIIKLIEQLKGISFKLEKCNLKSDSRHHPSGHLA